MASSEQGRRDLDDLLSDPYCRQLLVSLRRADGPVPLAALATDVAARVTGVPPEAVDASVRRRLQTWFHHGQLPALSERGVVAYDPDTGLVWLLDER